jgi:hypothetical protein
MPHRELRKIKFERKTKKPVEKEWRKPENWMHAGNSQRQAWLREDGNYGVRAGYGLAISDADHEELKEIVKSKLPPSPVVETTGHKRFQYCFRSNLTCRIYLRTSPRYGFNKSRRMI